MNQTEISQTLLKMVNALESLLSHLPADRLIWKPTPDDWCVLEVIGHLIDADKHAFLDRIAFIVEHDGEPFPAWSAKQAAAERDVSQASLDAMLAELRFSREKIAEFLAELDPARLDAAGISDKYGPFLARDFLLEWPFHDHDHLQQILDILKKSYLPGMSDTMRQALG